MQRFLQLLGLMLAGSAGLLAQQSVVRQYNIAQLPAAASNSGVVALVKDGIGPTDCTAGGGSYAVHCKSNGTSWIALGGGGGGGGEGQVWRKFIVSYADLSQASSSKAVNLFTLAARQKLCGISIYVTAGFTASPTLSAATVSIGDSLGTATTYTASALSLLTPTGNDYNVFGSVYPGTGIVQANVTVSGALLSNLTAGSIEIDACTISLP